MCGKGYRVTVVTAVCAGSPRSPWNPRCKCGRRASGPPQRLTPTRARDGTSAIVIAPVTRALVAPVICATRGRRPGAMACLGPSRRPGIQRSRHGHDQALDAYKGYSSGHAFSLFLARGQARGYKPSGASAADYPEPWGVKRAFIAAFTADCKLRSQQTVTLR